MDSATSSRSRTNSFSLSGSGEIRAIPQQNTNQRRVTYKNLINLARADGVVRLEQHDQFFVITHPSKLNSFTSKAPFLGWKLHLSIASNQLEEAYDLAAPIIDRYQLCFKVVNNIGGIADERFIFGAQITIFLEEQEKQAVRVEEVGEMIEEIHRIFLLNEIQPGVKPDSDAKTSSSFFSIRNDKCKPLLNRNIVGYVPARVAGRHFNPMNNLNCFSQLLKEDTTPFDPLAHFEQFGLAENDDNTSYRLIDTMTACIHEYTHFQTLSEETKDTIILQYCRGTECEHMFLLKDAYKNTPEIMLLIKHAFTIVLMSEADSSIQKSCYFEYLRTAQLSSQYSEKNSFKKLFKLMEAHAIRQIEQYRFIQFGQTVSLLELYIKTKLLQNSVTIFPLSNGSKYSHLISDAK